MEVAIDYIDSIILSKVNLGAMLVDKLGANKREALNMVDAFLAVISERLVADEEVNLSKLAAFQVRTKAPRPGRNPRTGEVVEIGTRSVVTFQSSPKLKARLKCSPQ